MNRLFINYSIPFKRVSQKLSLLYIVVIIIILGSCSEDKSKISDPKDYDRFLSTDRNDVFINTQKNVTFWSIRLRPDSTGVGDLIPLANSYTKLFETTGNIGYLKDAEVLLNKAYSLASLNKDEYGRSLAHNFIAQHRFKEALQLLDSVYKGVSNKRSTSLMLFDTYLEVGEYDKAYQLLSEFESKEDFDYLIRMVRWNDHKGNSEAVIRTMERAKDIAESRNDEALMIWTYNNLATVYGHSGKIEESYHYFLKSLQIQPEQIIPKRGIAWIVYSYEKDFLEADRIMDSIMIQHISPDHIVFRSVLAQFNNDEKETQRYRNEFIDHVENIREYGLMYQMDLIEFYAENDPERSVRLAELELENRATPVIYSMLAYAHLKNGNIERSLQIIKDHVEGKTFEPIAHYYSAWIYLKAGKKDNLKQIMDQIESAQFELGPVRIRELTNSIRND